MSKRQWKTFYMEIAVLCCLLFEVFIYNEEGVKRNF